MNRLARVVRTVGGLVLLSHLVCFFFPFSRVVQENYPTKEFSQYSEVSGLFEKGIAQFGRGMEKDVLAVILLCILLSVLLSLIFGIWGIVGSRRQRISGVGSVLVALLDAGFLWNIDLFQPERVNEVQEFQVGTGRYGLMGIAVLSAIFGVAVLICTPRKSKIKKAERIPAVAAIREEQLKPQYTFIDEAELKKDALEASWGQQSGTGQMPETGDVKNQQSGTGQMPETGAAMPRGVMVGLAGVFAGAEIPFQAQETLKLGRDQSNDLIFTNADRVSRNHCEITWYPDRGKFRILDRSSNGCFVNGREECIPQNIPLELEPGTVLDIGNQANRFRLE